MSFAGGAYLCSFARDFSRNRGLAISSRRAGVRRPHVARSAWLRVGVPYRYAGKLRRILVRGGHDYIPHLFLHPV